MKLSVFRTGKAICTIVILAFVLSCTRDTSVQDREEQELRYLDIYITSRYPGAEMKEDGLFYVENRAGTGVGPGPEDWLLVNHVGYEIPEEKVFVSYIENVAKDHNLDPEGIAIYGPFKMLNGTINQGFTQGVSYMREGGQATILFPSSLGYGNNGNSLVGPFSSLKYEIELLEVIPDIEVYEQGKIGAYLDTIAVYDTIHDTGTDAVMYYIIDHATDGQLIELDSAVSLSYKGALLDGRVFDETVEGNPYKFTMGQAEHIAGWNLGLLRLREGEKARLLIPYPLAYGEIGRIESGIRAIPPYETLLFHIEVLKVGGKKEDSGLLPEQQ